MENPAVTHLIDQRSALVRDLFDHVGLDLNDVRVESTIRLLCADVEMALEIGTVPAALVLDAYRAAIGVTR